MIFLLEGRTRTLRFLTRSSLSIEEEQCSGDQKFCSCMRRTTRRRSKDFFIVPKHLEELQYNGDIHFPFHSAASKRRVIYRRGNVSFMSLNFSKKRTTNVIRSVLHFLLKRFGGDNDNGCQKFRSPDSNV